MSGNRLNSKSILYVIFFLSGATGLVYEVIWVRLTGLVFGNTSHAISIVLGSFMAGLALGSWKLGRKADITANPLRLYGMLELGIGISAALVPLVFRALDTLYLAIAQSVSWIPGGGLHSICNELHRSGHADVSDGRSPDTHAVSPKYRSGAKVDALYALNTFRGCWIAPAALVLFGYQSTSERR
jgi:hypothetical protein